MGVVVRWGRSFATSAINQSAAAISTHLHSHSRAPPLEDRDCPSPLPLHTTHFISAPHKSGSDARQQRSKSSRFSAPALLSSSVGLIVGAAAAVELYYDKTEQCNTKAPTLQGVTDTLRLSAREGRWSAAASEVVWKAFASVGLPGALLFRQDVECESDSGREERARAQLRKVKEGSHSPDAPASSESDSCYIENARDELTNIKIFSGSPNHDLARDICSHLGLTLGRAKVCGDANNETLLELLDEVRGKDVFIIQSAPSASSAHDLHTAIMELLFMISAAKRSSAKRVTAVLPYMAYFRQPLHADVSLATPLGGSDLAKIMVAMGVDRVVFVDVHTKRAEGFFMESMPITNLQPQSLAIQYFKRKAKECTLKDVAVVATENTGGERAKAFWLRLKRAGISANLASMVSNRPPRGQKEAEATDPVLLRTNAAAPTSPHFLPSTSAPPTSDSSGGVDWVVGDVGGRDCIIVDDIVDTGERAVNTAKVLKQAGARRIFMFATHGIFSKGAIDRIISSPIKELVVTDTIKIPQNICCEKLRVISVSKLLAEAIQRIHDNAPVSPLHRDEFFDSLLTEEQQNR